MTAFSLLTLNKVTESLKSPMSRIRQTLNPKPFTQNLRPRRAAQLRRGAERRVGRRADAGHVTAPPPARPADGLSHVSVRRHGGGLPRESVDPDRLNSQAQTGS